MSLLYCFSCLCVLVFLFIWHFSVLFLEREGLRMTSKDDPLLEVVIPEWSYFAVLLRAGWRKWGLTSYIRGKTELMKRGPLTGKNRGWILHERGLSLSPVTAEPVGYSWTLAKCLQYSFTCEVKSGTGREKTELTTNVYYLFNLCTILIIIYYWTISHGREKLENQLANSPQ